MPNDTPPTPEAIAEATTFLREILQLMDTTWGDPEQVFPFFQQHLTRFDESLLHAIPQEFAERIAQEPWEKHWRIATLFVLFGIQISEFPLSDRALNLEISIAAYQEALQVYTREAFPQDWAGTQNNLGNIYCERIRGKRADNLEWAIAAYQSALQVYTHEAFPQEWAMTQNNLGNAYSDHIRGERADNLERAIAAYQAALQVYTREAFPQEWAMTQNNLGIAYRNRIRGERANNLERAIAAYQAALQVYTREAFPQEWAMTQGNLAGALITQATLIGDPTKLDTAIALLQEDLEVAILGIPSFINGQYNLGNALSRRYEQNQNPEDLQQAIAAYTTALNTIDPEHYGRPSIWQAIPETQSILGSRLVKEGRWQEGLQLLLQSVRQLSSGDNLLAHANALYQTGRAHETMADWNNARLYYRDALRLYAHLGDTLGIAQSHAGLGGVLVSRGFLEKGMAELATAKELYHQLDKPQQVQDLEQLYAAAQRILAKQSGDSSEARV